MIKVLITGASGFIGKHVQNILREPKFSVYPASRMNLKGYINFDPFNLVQSLKTLEEIAPHTVLNLSWHTAGLDYLISPKNEDALCWNTSLFEVIAKSSVKQIISIGSSVEGGSTPYAKSKLIAREKFHDTFRDTDIKTSWLRIFQLYGPGQSSTRLIPSLFNHISNNSVFALKNPTAIRDWIDVRDVADAIKCLIAEPVESEFEIGTAVGTENQQICEFMHQKFGLRWRTSELSGSEVIDRLVASNSTPLFKYFHPRRQLFEFLESYI